MRAPARQSGFTLLELVIVLALLSIVLAIAAPSLARWGWGRELANAGDEVLTATRWARGQAIATGTPHRVEFDLANRSFHVTRLVGQQWTAAEGEFGTPVQISDRLRIEVERADDAGAVIDLLPNGRVSPVEITITSEDGSVRTLSSPGAAEPLRVVGGGGGSGGAS